MITGIRHPQRELKRMTKIEATRTPNKSSPPPSLSHKSARSVGDADGVGRAVELMFDNENFFRNR